MNGWHDCTALDSQGLRVVVALLRRMHAMHAVHCTGFLTKDEVILSSLSMQLIIYTASPVLLVVWSDPQNFSLQDQPNNSGVTAVHFLSKMISLSYVWLVAADPYTFAS